MGAKMYDCWVTLAPKGPAVLVRSAVCESAGHLWGAGETQQACIDALKTYANPRTGRVDWTHGLVLVRRPPGLRNLADEITTTVYPTDRVEKYEGATPTHDENTLSRAEARAAECPNCHTPRRPNGACACSGPWPTDQEIAERALAEMPERFNIQKWPMVNLTPEQIKEMRAVEKLARLGERYGVGGKNLMRAMGVDMGKPEGGTFTVQGPDGKIYGPFRHDEKLPTLLGGTYRWDNRTRANRDPNYDSYSASRPAQPKSVLEQEQEEQY